LISAAAKPTWVLSFVFKRLDMKFHRSRPLLVFLCMGLALTLSACGKKTSPAQSTQVAATVGEEEISVHQINQVLQQSSLSNESPLTISQKRREILDKLIDQELAVTQAKAAKLHRSPDVVLQLEAARRDILVRAYMQQVSRGLPKPSTTELKQYYAGNPALFSRRRIFDMQELVVPTTPGIDEELRRFASTDQSIEQASQWLQSRDIKFNSGGASRAAEQLPLELLSLLDGLKDGQSLVVSNERGTTLLRLASSQSMPITEAVALPRIEQYLINKLTTEALASQLKTLRAETKITYLGEFAQPNVPAAPLPSAQAEGTQGAAATKPLTVVEKGMSGLK
jgi:EpsD family peptidyl-prolyl cis-trans isomerase